MDYIDNLPNDAWFDLYNTSGFSNAMFTGDVDWAPDFAVAHVIDLFQKYDVPLTLFATHKSSVFQNYQTGLEVGLHPNNTRPTYPQFFSDEMKRLKDLYPDSVGLRCHRNFFGNNISDIAKEVGVGYDLSVLMWLNSCLQVYKDYNGIIRAPYFWEDGMHCDMNLPRELSQIPFNTPGLKIFNIHPILIYLNSPNDDHRRSVTSRYSDLTQASYDEIKADRYEGYGIGSFLEDILKHTTSSNVTCILGRDLLRKP